MKLLPFKCFPSKIQPNHVHETKPLAIAWEYLKDFNWPICMETNVLKIIGHGIQTEIGIFKHWVQFRLGGGALDPNVTLTPEQWHRGYQKTRLEHYAREEQGSDGYSKLKTPNLVKIRHFGPLNYDHKL